MAKQPGTDGTDRFGGDPLTHAFDRWAKALWQDDRIRAAWEVAAETKDRIKNWKRAQKDQAPLQRDKPPSQVWPTTSNTSSATSPSPQNIPWAVPWEELEEQGIEVPTRTRRIRGKYNVPRERFHTTGTGFYRKPAPLANSKG